MAREDFPKQLQALGYDVNDLGDGKYSFRYKVLGGSHARKEFAIGYVIPTTYPAEPPPGPHVSPRIHANAGGGLHPTGGIHDSPFGAEWHYWSRPMGHWAKSKKDASVVIAFLKGLFESQ